MDEYEKRIVKETTERFDRVVNLIISESKTPRDYGSGELLHFAEIHAINFIGFYKKISRANEKKKSFLISLCFLTYSRRYIKM